MKRNDWILITATALYTFLFYQQAAGINFLIFNLALITGICLKDRHETLNLHWWLAAAGSLATAVCVTLYGNTFSIVVNIISLSLLAGISFSSRSSVVLTLLYSWYSYFSALVFMVLDYIERKKNQPEHNNSVFTKKLILVLVPVIVTLIFFFIYKSSSALFNDFAQKINLDFISWSWVRFTLLGFVILYGFFYHRQLRTLANIDEQAKADIQPGQGMKVNLFGKELEINDENFSGTVLFVLLNVLLLIVNYLDFNYLFVDGKLPEGISYSEFVHQGVGMLIVSIVVAIAIVLFYFRGELNFFHKNRVLKAFAYLWILQNAAMVVLTVFRNEIYISEYALTYKRIGVFIYLGLALIGLITTLIKIAAVKSNNYLFRINGWLFYIAFAVLSFFNWDKIITDFNIRNSKETDICYLTELSWTNLPQMIRLDTVPGTSMFTWGAVQGDCYPVYGLRFSTKLYNFMLTNYNGDWRGWSYDRARVYSQLSGPQLAGKITSLNLSNINTVNLEAVKQFTKVNDLNISGSDLKDIASLHHFPELKNLDISLNDIKTLKGIEKLKQLEKIVLSDNPIDDYAPLYELKNLKEIHINGQMTRIDSLEMRKHLPNVIINY